MPTSSSRIYKDKNAKDFDLEPWETAALKLQGRLFRGATSYPSRGSYRRTDETGAISDEGVMIEQTRMVVSFVAEPDFTDALVVDGEMYYL